MTTYQLIKQIEAREAYQLADGGEIADDIRAIKEDRREFNGLGLGYHVPAGANWGYSVELIGYNGRHYEIVKRFGQALHVAYTSLYNYEREGAENEK